MPSRFIDSPDIVGKLYAAFDWDIYGSEYRNIQKQAQRSWGIRW
jgi:hypothetical protein